MSQPFQERLQAIDRTMLTPLAQQALDSPEAQVLDWTQRPLTGGAAQPEEGILGRLLLSGHAQIHGQVVPWSLVLKAFAPPSESTNDNPALWTYWKREVLTYQSGLLDRVKGGLVVPRYYAVVEYPDEEYWVWMEYVVEETKYWPLERYGVAARHLGQFNGAHLLPDSRPEYPWFSVEYLRQWLASVDSGLQELHRLAQHPRSWITPEALKPTLRLCAERERLLDQLARLPQCLCHHDAFRRNLLARRSANSAPQTVAIDWAAIGPGAIGEEIGMLVAGSLVFLETPAESATSLDALVFAGYLQGLHEAGWQGDEKKVRFAYCATIALFLAVLTPGFLLPGIEDDEQMAAREAFMGHPLEVVHAQWRSAHEFGLQLGDAARTLLTYVA